VSRALAPGTGGPEILETALTAMGQGRSMADEGPPLTPTSEAPERGREGYLNKLGIGKAGVPTPKARAVEAPAVMEHTPEEQREELTLRDLELKFLDLKVQDDFRMNYLRRLSYAQVWVPQARRPPKHQTVIIFDWDDTLLCTSWLNLRRDQVLPPNIDKHLRDIEAAGIRLIELAQRLGHTFIITNAMCGWVELSAAQWIPAMIPILERVRVISARTKYETQFPGEVSKWKVNAFLEVQRQLDSQIITNLISLGDSNFEMDAVHVMGKEFQQALVKTIKFREHPSPEELVKQLQLVASKFEKIVENARNLKIGLERKWVQGPGQQQPSG